MTLLRHIKRGIYGTVVGLSAYTSAGGNAKEVKGTPRVFYGGARGGHRGGPQVKVALLQQAFPEYSSGFDLLYLLSGALYMPPWAIERLKDKDVSVVLNQNGVFYPAWYPNEWQAENERMAKALSLADHVFYQSEFCKRCADRFLGVSAKSSEILYNAVDTNVFVPNEIKQTRKRFRFLLSGNIGHSTYYRLTNALEGLALARQQGLDIEILFAGILPDQLMEKFQSAVEAAGLQDFFLMRGPYERHEAPQTFAAADAYLITKHNDPCPNVVLEAMACGLPVLYSASGGIPEQVGTEAGIGMAVSDTFEENPIPSPQQIVEGMAQIMLHHESQSDAARKRAVEKFDISLWIGRHREMFQHLRQAG